MSHKSIEEVEAEIQAELRQEKAMRKARKGQFSSQSTPADRYYQELHKHKHEKERQDYENWKQETYVKPHISNDLVGEIFATDVIDLAKTFKVLGIDALYHEEAVRRFKRNQNKMKQLLIEENARQKKELDDFIQESRALLAKVKTEFVENIRASCNLMQGAAKDFEKECKKLVKEKLSKSEAAKQAQKVAEKAEKELLAMTQSSEEQFQEIKRDLDKSLGESMRQCRQMSQVYKGNLKKLYEKEKEVALKVIDAEETYIETLDAVEDRLENNAATIVNEVVTKRLVAAEMRYSKLMSRIVKMLAPHIDTKPFVNLMKDPNFITKGAINNHDLYHYASQNDVEEDRYNT